MKTAICCIVKNEPINYLKEFISHHLSIGFDKVFLYNNNNSIEEQQDDFKLLQNTFKDRLDIIYFEGKCKQFDAYIDCTEKHKEEFDWIAYIDADEFIEVERASIKDILKDITAPALGLNWQIFGTGEYNNVSQIESFTKGTDLSFEPNKHVKVIAQPKEITLINNPHNFYFKDDRKAVNILGEEIDTYYTKTPVNKIAWINHYYCRTEKDKQIKLQRGRADADIPYDKSIFDNIDNNTYSETHSVIIEKQRKQRIALITPTGNRDFQIKLCAKYMLRQNFTGYVDWYIIDDCLPFTSDFIKEQCKRTNWNIYIIHPAPYWKEGDNTQGRNLSMALNSITISNKKYDGIFFIEDDDWYCSDYLSITLSHLDNNDITGGMCALYWNIPNNVTERCNNVKHSSLCQTAMKPVIIPYMQKVIQQGNRFFDMDLFDMCHRWNMDINLFRSVPDICVGIKGLSGRGGIGNFHKVTTHIPNNTKENLQVIMGADYDIYRTY